MSYSEQFLIEALRQLKEDDKWYGFGPNAYDRDKVIKALLAYENRDRYENWFQHYCRYWIDEGNIFKYRKQLANVFYREEYRRQSKGW